uniref:Uncharacterized protein n=1 Tax=Aegilops tauschii subsp. strangulata TaxID=200361 RepID=A0A453QQU7_AEGTS
VVLTFSVQLLPLFFMNFGDSDTNFSCAEVDLLSTSSSGQQIGFEELLFRPCVDQEQLQIKVDIWRFVWSVRIPAIKRWRQPRLG